MSHIKLSPKETVQDIVDKSFGENKAKLTDNGRLIFLFPTLHHGCNEMEVGTWRFDNKGVFIFSALSYDEAYVHLKNGTKPFKQTRVTIQGCVPKK